MAIKKRPVSPRQKMINLMYVVLMAMLALNVSNEVLNGFSIVEESLKRTTMNATKENQAISANQVMLAPSRGRGKELFDAINNYRAKMLTMVNDYHQKQMIASNLTTDIPKNEQTLGKNWQEYMFESMPAAAAVTLLSKLQNDVRYAEGEVLHTLVSNIDVKDIRVNALNAFVIPNSQTIVRGDKFSAHIVMAAVDTTQVPQIFIGGKEVNLPGGLYETITSRTGDFTLAGHIQMVNGNGEIIKRDFEQKYTVVDPSATVSADLMNVLYAGYSNPLSVSVPGVPVNKVQATMTGGTLQPVGPGRYIARPTAVGQNVTITVTSTNTGRAQQMGQFTFRVRRLPDPTPYIAMKDESGSPIRYKGGGLSKAQLMGVDGIGAAIDDGILDIAFKVQSFETVFFDNMGNAVPMVSDGANFSARQKETFRKLTRNRRFYISRVNAIGPDGIPRKLNASMEVIVK